VDNDNTAVLYEDIAYGVVYNLLKFIKPFMKRIKKYEQLCIIKRMLKRMVSEIESWGVE